MKTWKGNGMKHLFFCILLITAVFCQAEMILVESGKSNSVIVSGTKPTKSAQLGALELQHHIMRMTGVKIPISARAEKDKINIYVGGDNSGLKDETARIKFGPKSIRLTGNDSPEFGKVDYDDYKTFPSYRYQFNGSLWAVYEFLEKYCGIRFYGIGDDFVTYRPQKTLRVAEKDWQHTPKMDLFRDIFLHTDSHSKRDVALWRLRWRLAEFTPPANHNMYSMYFRFHGKAKSRFLAPLFKEKRPEYFARGFKLTGTADPRLKNNYPGDKTLPPQLCYTSNGVRDWYIHEVLTYAGGKNLKGGFGNKDGTIEDTSRTMIPRIPGRTFYYPIEGGDNGKFCQCVSCKPFVKDNNNFSALKFTLMSKIAEGVAKKDPGAGVSTLAYILSMYYPDKVKLADNMMVQICLTVYSWWHPTAYRLQHGEYKKWIAREGSKRPLTLWTYLFGSPWDARIHFGKYHPFPTFYPRKTGELFKEFADDGIRGWFCEVQLQYHLLEAYIAARLCYDPSADTDKIIDQFFTDCYGPAGKMMKEFYREVETAFWNPANCPEKWLKDPKVFRGPYGIKHPFWGTGLISPELSWKTMGTPKRMAKLKKLIAEAESQELTPPQRKRLNLFLKNTWGPALRGEAEFAKNQQSAKRGNSPAIRLLKQSAGGDPDKVNWSDHKPFLMMSMDGTKVAPDKFYLASDRDHLYFSYETTKDFGGHGRVIFCFSSADGKQIRTLEFGQKLVDLSGSNSLKPLNFRSKEDASGWLARGAIRKSDLPFQAGSLKANIIRRVEAAAEKAEDIVMWQPTWYADDYTSPKYFGYLTVFPQIIQEKSFRLDGKACIVGDPAATDKKAGCMDAAQGWTMKIMIPQEICGKRKVTFLLRTDVTDPKAKFSIGVYDKFNRKMIYSRQIKAAAYSGNQYRQLVFDGVNLIPGSYLFLASLQPKTTVGKHHYYVDMVIFE